MKAKSTLTALCSAMILSLATSTGAYAASTQRVYSSGILVLVFIGFVALVVVVQMIPAIITLCGMLKGLASNRKTVAAEARTK
jgi:ABC-type glycerol-3-phosphate transport system permease component